MGGIGSGMQNLWTGYSETKEQRYERLLIKKWGGIPEMNLKIGNVSASPIEEDKIHYISLATGTKVPYVFIPGYGASGALYYKLMKDISTKYDMYLVDMRGMGGSGRPPFLSKSQSEAENYILEGLEAWRKEMGIEKMILSGHSLGGYMATKYTKKYPTRVIALILESPAGVWPKPPDFEAKMNTIVSKLGFFKRQVFKIASGFWVPGNSPIQILRRFGRISTFALGKYVKFYKHLAPNEQDDLKEYLYQILMKPGTGELSISYLLEKGAYGVDPLKSYLNQVKIPTSIFFGTKDWVARGKPEGFQFSNPCIRMHTISGASHHIQLDNSKDLIKGIIEDLESLPKSSHS